MRVRIMPVVTYSNMNVGEVVSLTELGTRMLMSHGADRRLPLFQDWKYLGQRGPETD